MFSVLCVCENHPQLYISAFISHRLVIILRQIIYICIFFQVKSCHLIGGIFMLHFMAEVLP